MKRTARFVLVSFFITTAAGAPALAQAKTETPSVGLQRIVVTTQKREEAAFDVPITLTAYNQDRLDVFDLDAFDELSNFVPGLNVQLQSPNNPGWVIRGITTDSGNFQDPPRVSVYLNGVDVSRSRGSAFEIFDVDRIEVAKGPQATLFGTAASVGAVSVITARPEQEFSGEAYLSYGSYNAVKVGGHVTGGAEAVQGRLAVQYRARDGYVTNIAGNSGSNAFTAQKDLQGVNALAIRPSLRFTPTDRFTADLIFNYERNDSPGTAFKSTVISPSGGDTDPSTFAELAGAYGNPLVFFDGVGSQTLQPQLLPLADQDIADFLGGDELGLEREIYDVNVQASWELTDALSVTGVAGYREFDSLEVFDADGSAVPLIEASEDTEGEQQSYELRANFDAGGRLRGFAGVSYFAEEGFQRVPFALDETLFASCLATGPDGDLVITSVCVNADGSFNRLNIDAEVAGGQPLVPANTRGAFGVWYPAESANFSETVSISVFADATYELTDAIEVTGGLRFLTEERESAFSSVFPNSLLVYQQTLLTLSSDQIEAVLGANPGADPIDLFSQPLLDGFVDTNGELVSRSLSQDDVLPRFNVLWRAKPGLNLYATISEGRRASVFVLDQNNADDPAGLTPVDAETVWSYETGLKADLLGGLAQVEAAIFLQEYENFRVQVQNPGTGTSQPVDTGYAENLGFEFSGAVQPMGGLTFIGTFAYLDAETGNSPSNGDLAGQKFRLQPETSGSLTADYRTGVFDSLEAFATLNYSYRSEVFFTAVNEPALSEDAVSLFDLRLGLGEQSGHWQVSAFGSNIFDTDYVIDGGNTGALFGSPTVIAGPPAMWGVELRGRF